MQDHSMIYGPETLQSAVAAQMGYIRGTVYNLTKDHERLEDYAQAAYVACVERIAKCNGDFRQYCALTTMWTVRSIRKAELRERNRLGDNAALGSIFAAIPDMDQRKAIKQAFKQLTPNHRSILRQHFAGKLPSDQRMNLSRARKSLAQLLQVA